MATLAESFLADLDDLSDGSDHDEEPQKAQADTEMLDGDELSLRLDDLASVAKLASSDKYKRIMREVHALLDRPEDDAETSWTGPSDEDPTYQLLVDCNQLAVDIDNEIVLIHTFMKDKYRRKFPELESFVHDAVTYARVVQAIGNEMDLTLVDLEKTIPQHIIMGVTVTATTTSGKPLSTEDLGSVQEAAAAMLALDAHKAVILRLVQQRMHKIAPNLSAALGTEIAARLMGIAGGLLNLSKMPGCNIQVLGQKKKNLGGLSTATAGLHQGFVFAADVIQNAPPEFQQKAARLVGSKAALLARMDAYGQDPSGAQGSAMKEEMQKKVEKWQELPPAKQTRVLAKPDMEPKSRRGGARLRKMKERFGMTDMRKEQNRMEFGKAEEEIVDGDEIVGLGMLGKDGGRLRLQAKAQQQKMSAKTAKKMAKRHAYTGGAAVSGLSSSLAFTPVQGIELVNPSLRPGQETDQKSGTESYFSDYSGFRSIKRAKI